MPHSDKSTRDPWGRFSCPYCGAPLAANQHGREVTCPACSDLPALEPLDDRYLIGKDGRRG